MTMSESRTVLDFWIEAGPEKWWRKNPAFDAEIAKRFQPTHAQACESDLDDWAITPDGALALIIVLDQFSRNLHRNSKLAYAQDGKTASLARVQVVSGTDQRMPREIHQFCYLPLMHSENLEDQDLCLQQMRRFGDEGSIRSAVQHREIIDRFGRFPHRNAILGRNTTEAEQVFLDDGGFSG
jgi:uncharacterized protein (DUF924 family)